MADSNFTIRDYYKNCFLLGYILRLGKHPWLNFCLVFVIFLAIIVTACWTDQIFKTRADILGLFNDYLFIAIVIIMLPVVFATLHLIERLEKMLQSLDKFIVGSTTKKVKIKLEQDKTAIRNFVSINSRNSKIVYWILIGIFI